MFTEAQNFAVVQTELDSVFYQEFDYDSGFPSIATAQTEALFKPLRTEHAAYIHDIYKGSGLFPTIGELATVPLATPKVANKQTINILDFAQGIELSKNLFDDNMHGVWAKTVADFAMVARVSQDQNAFKIFRNATTTTLTADGVAFGSASHVTLGGQTVSNLITTSTLTSTTLNNAIVKLRQQPNQAGVIMGNTPSILLVPSPLYKLAIELTESALIADSANNALNVYRSAYGITVYTSPYMDAVAGGSDSTWFLLSRNHSVTRLVRQGVETALRPWQMSNNRTYLYQANFREEVFVSDYCGAIVATA